MGKARIPGEGETRVRAPTEGPGRSEQWIDTGDPGQGRLCVAGSKSGWEDGWAPWLPGGGQNKNSPGKNRLLGMVMHD